MDSISLVRLNGGRNERKRIAGADAQRTLYPFFLDSVNADTILCGGKQLLPFDPPPGSRERLAAGLDLAVQRLPVHITTGDLDYVASTVAL
jgi:hypothetical protein